VFALTLTVENENRMGICGWINCRYGCDSDACPQSGKDTQELLAGKFRGGLDQVASAGKKVRDQVKDLTNRGKEKVAEAIDTGKEAYRTSGAGG
jgi:hypothetical protein